MKPALILGGVSGMLAAALVAWGQAPAPPAPPTSPTPGAPAAREPAPTEMTIIVPEVEVRSGPSEKFYPTGKMYRGQRVTVLRENPRAPGWYEIKPPPGSFSWINAVFVEKQKSPYGVVRADPNTPVPVMAGSLSHQGEPNVETDKVKRGTQVTILDPTSKVSRSGSGSWLTIEPTAGEVRYVPAQALQGGSGVQVAAARAPAGPVGTAVTTVQSRTGEDDLMQRVMRLDPAQKRQLLELLGGQAAAPPQPGHPGNSSAVAGYAPGQAASMTNRQPAAPKAPLTGSNPPAPTAAASSRPGQAQWSSWGVLRKTALTRDGQLYVLQDERGVPLLYAMPQAGQTLEPYVGRTIAMYGPVTYRSDDLVRAYYMTPLYVAPPQQ
ncbi:MAG: hypothetical protein IT429_00720 [Gemmataceae bacterium]|nr:hypothetical protein [Gemmataceae bacterium]